MANFLQLMPLLFVVLLGLVAGSFVSVLIYRIPREESIVWGRSHCRSCNHLLGMRDLVPLISFLSTMGKCRYCKTVLPLTYPIIEVTTSLLFLLAYWLTIATQPYIPVLQLLTLVYLALLFIVLAALFFIDLYDLLLPDTLVFSSFFLVFLYHVLYNFLYTLRLTTAPVFSANFLMLLTQNLQPFAHGVLAGFAVAVVFFLLIVATKGRGMGGGDVKFALVMGAVIGWPNLLVALFLAFFLGAIISIFLLLLRKKQFGQTIPFGPFLIIGTLSTLVWGDQLVQWFLYGNHLTLFG